MCVHTAVAIAIAVDLESWKMNVGRYIVYFASGYMYMNVNVFLLRDLDCRSLLTIINFVSLQKLNL